MEQVKSDVSTLKTDMTQVKQDVETIAENTDVKLKHKASKESYMKRIAVIFLLTLIIFWILLLPILSSAELSITVVPAPSWGNMSHSDIQTLCENISFHFEKHLRPENEMNDTVNVYRSFDEIHVTLDPNPVAKYKIGMLLKKDMEIRVDDFYYFIWSFGHEICHILHNFELTTIDNPNLWFQEGIASMASVWVLRSMADTWEHDSPFGTFVEQDGGIAYFSDNFEHFANAYLNVFPEYQYNGTGEEWLEEYEIFLREDYYKTRSFTQYHLVSQLSYKFLPIFEENPEAWNAVRKMPASTGEMSEYMQDWHDNVDTEDKQFVEAIADEMGITVEEAMPVTTVVMDTELTIDADVNDDGYVDLYDVLIVRSGMNAEVSYDTDVNNDGKTDEVDLLIVKALAIEAITKASPSKRKVKITTWGSMKSDVLK